MPKVLLISYYYPPHPAIGSLRPRGLAKYLPEFGWDVVVLTPERVGRQNADGNVIETGYRDVLHHYKAKLGLDPRSSLHSQLHLPLSSKRNRVLWHTKALELVKSWLAYPDFAKGWISFATEAIANTPALRDVDAILTTSPPATVHLLGARAKAVLKRPWIADFRDLWTQNLTEDGGLLQPLKVRLEKKTLDQADSLVTVSHPWTRRLQERFPRKKFHTITNGFDPDEFDVERPPLTKEFSITYAGQLYEGRRDPTLLLETLAELIREGRLADDVRVRFYGPIEPWLPLLIDRLGLGGVVQLQGVVKRDEALRREMESQLLLLLGWYDTKETGQHTGKLFEYFGAARPILATGGGRGVLTEVLEETRTGIHALSKEQLRGFLLETYADFRQNGAVPYNCDPEAMERYTHRSMARVFAEVLNDVTNQPTALPATSVLRPATADRELYDAKIH